MPLTKYHFKNAANGFFEMPRDNARDILPPHLQPMEIRHGQGVFAVTAFDFTDSMVGPYTEVVLAVIVPPLLKPADPMPKSAFYPFLVATSTTAARDHAIERWHLPHYMRDIDVDFEEADGRMKARVHEGQDPIVEFTISAHAWTDTDDLYQSFMHTETQRFKANVHMNGRFTEHEEETGELILHNHPMCELLRIDEIASYPFREMWMKDGVQTFEELETI
jgi:hypothetical protein